jgi:hypothetical protein
MHTDRDIAIFVPEEGLVVVGDVALDGWIPFQQNKNKKEIKECWNNQ